MLLDQFTKWWVSTTFVPGQSQPLLPPLVYLTYVQNTGAAFGILRGQQLFFILMSVVIIGWLGWELWRSPTATFVYRLGASLIIGGAIGNLLDRLRLHYVVDFIDLRVWPVFNAGDSAITIGVLLMLWHSLRRRPA